MSSKQLVSNINLPKNFKFIDLFAGIGGFNLALTNFGGVCVFASEIDRHACETYEMNHGHKPHGDITKIDVCDIPDHDVLTAGFPCQPFSQAGHKLGIADTRGTLFFDIVRIIKAKTPKFLILENVRGLISNDKGQTILTILKELDNAGYDTIIPKHLIDSGNIKKIQTQAKKMLLNSRYFGVPQNRVRIYIVAWQKNLKINYVYPEQVEETSKVSDILESAVDSKYTLSDKLWAGHQRRKEKNKAAGKGFGYSIVDASSLYTNTISARYYKDGSEILVKQKGRNPRKLTPREAARLQSFPETFKLPKSDNQAYKQFGNSITVNVAKAVLDKLIISSPQPLLTGY